MAEIGHDGLRRDLRPQPIPFAPQSIAAMVMSLRASTNVALIDRHETLSYSEFVDRVHATAVFLQSLELRSGMIIAGSAPNQNRLSIAFFASQLLGLIWVGINPPLAPPEKAAQLADCGAALFLGDEKALAQIKDERCALPGLRMMIDLSGPDAQFDKLIGKHLGERSQAALPDPLAPAVIGYTSGTTGLPKGVVHNQHNIMAFVNACLNSDEGGQWIRGARRALSVPITNPNGMNYGPVTALTAGGSFVAIDRSDAGGVGEWIDRHQVEVLNSTPTTIRDLLFKSELQHLSLASLKAVAVGGSAPSPDILDAFRQRFGFELICDYGQTEGPSSMVSTLAHEQAPEGSTGLPHPHIQLAIMSPDGAALPDGSEGELCVSAPDDGAWAGVFTGMLGYWNKPEETRAAFFDDRWLRTGDMGVIGADGYLKLVGRKKEMILRGGANIYPAEIEHVLRGHDVVDDIVVKGLPDERLGEIVAAYIVLAQPERVMTSLATELRDWSLARLARYKTPERWFVVEQIPRNALNKPMRDRLDEAVIAEWTV